MKNTLITFLLIAAVQFSFAQNTIAKLKFEEAEELYTNEKYMQVLTKIDEVEKMLNSSNPKIIYLKILTESKIIEGMPRSIRDYPPTYAYSIIENIRENIKKYLKEYENLPDNEDKYREIYKISEKIKNYPNTEETYKLWVRPLLQEFFALDIKAFCENANRKNNSMDFIFEITPGKYDFIIINSKQYYFDELYPFTEDMTREQYDNRCRLLVQEDGSILFNGSTLLKLETKKYAGYVKEIIDDLQGLTYY